MEQVLIQHKAPFDIIADDHIGSLGRYRAVVLPEQESLSKDTVDRLLAYARNGGVLVFTGRTASYNERRERRSVNPLLSLIPPEARKRISSRAEGKGRLVYVPQILRARGGSDNEPVENPEIQISRRVRSERLEPSEWTLPKNHDEIFHAVTDHLSEGLSISTDAPLTTVMELVNRAKTRETIVHFINFDRKKTTGPFTVDLRKQFSGGVKSVTYISPDADDQKPLDFKEASGRLNFTAPATRLYGMVVVAYAAGGGAK
jgi:hypothetical protein